MRVIAGRFKGHKLVAFKADHIRPTTDRVKESLFNKIVSDLPGADVWDLFSGTGSLGIEALSRGAESVIFVEKSRKSVQILMQNIQKLKIQSEVQVKPMDVFSFLKKNEAVPDLIFVDPPFTKAIAHDVMLSIGSLPSPSEREVKVMIESSSQERIDDAYNSYKLLDRKYFGDKTLSIFSNQCD